MLPGVRVRATAPEKREPTMLSKIRVCADGDLALGMHGGKPRGDAGAGRRTVDLGLGEDADISWSARSENASSPSVRIEP